MTPKGKAQMAKAKAVNKIKIELSHYESAIAKNHQFSDYCISRSAELQAELDLLTQK
jgi:hypothetical protein